MIVLLLWSGQRLASYVLDATTIADVEVAPSIPSTSNLSTPTVSKQPSRQVSTHHVSQQPSQSSFVDPAILSYNKPIQPTLQPVSPIMIADGLVPSPMSQHGRSIAKQSSISSIATTRPITKPARRESEATAILTEPFDALDLSNVANKKSKKHKSTQSQTSQPTPGLIEVKDIHGPLKLPGKEKKPGKGKGWRNTPLIEERPTKSKRGRRTEDTNGWATEDATDIQDMGEFDFASNLSKFDKRQVFDDIRKDDTTLEDDRLVSFNRKARPGTNGGRNLHFTENVLEGNGSRAAVDDQWKSEAGETELEEEVEAERYSSGRGSRRANSRKPLSNRKSSALSGHVTAAAITANDRNASPRPLSRVATATLNGGGGSVNGLKALFRLPSNKPCHGVSPLQMLEIEQLCTSDLGLTEDMLSENAGRSIAEAVLQTSPEAKTVVFLIGNHKSGARSAVAARHLRNRRLRVTVILLGGEREDNLLESVRRQLTIYKKGGGWVERWDEYQAKLGSGAPKPDVVVDAILGVHVTFDELRTDDQAVAFEMTRWASRLASVISIDVPSGISASSGLITEAEGQLLSMDAKKVVCLGAPKIGLLNAMALASESEVPASWEVSVADVGISTAAWQRHGSRRRQGVEFGGEWVVNLRFVAG
jgi:enhancer of mRNA-decapping protein 3